jgi:hypothetical protein
VEGAQSSLQSAMQRGRHRCQGHLQRPVDRLHQSNLIVRLKAAQLLGGLADIAVVDVSQEAPITTRAHHCIIQSTVLGQLTRPSSTWTRRQFGKCASLTLLVAPRITKCDSPKWSDVGWRLRPSSLMLRRSMILTRRSRLVAY